ncbi:beta-lactamase family protein [Streptomyces sp. ISL-90]|nr:beta-lactamase family protein [Streptomyces sp. ISL-90]
MATAVNADSPTGRGGNVQMTFAHSGAHDQRFASVARQFESYAAADPGFSAQLSIRMHGDLMLEMAVGPYLSIDSVTGVYSVTKGVAGLVIATLIDQGLLELDHPVSTYWPEFAQNGKETVTVRQLLSHQAGLPLAARPLRLEELTDRSAAEVLAAQRPLWHPGTAFGYHALTIGVLMEELVRRLTGRTLQEVYETSIRAPLDADFFLGLPEAEEGRYIDMRDVELTDDQAEELATRPPLDSLAASVFANTDAPDDRSPSGVSSNNEVIRRSGPAAIGGVGSAHGLALLYAATLPGAPHPIASPDAFAVMAQQQSWGMDRVLNVMNCFGVVFMLPQPRLPFGGLGAYGHDGAGGALAFADPTTGLSFGYIPVPMQYPGGADHRSLELARLAAEATRGAS